MKIALLTNSLSPHSLPLWECLSMHVGEFRAFVSAESDLYHGFEKVQSTFETTVQRSFNHFRFLRRVYGRWQMGEFHIPYDTYGQLRRYAPQVILSGQLGVRTALAVVYRWRHPQVKLILWATLSDHTESNRNWLRLFPRKWILRHIDGAFVNGRGGEEYLQALGYAGKMFTIPYSIDGTPFAPQRPYCPSIAPLRLLYAGQLVPHKGILRFCAVLSEWCREHPDRNVELQLAGSGPDAAAIKALRKPANLRLLLLGKLAQEELARVYHAASIFAFPSLSDEWGVVVNEAMISGLPVLGSVYSQAAVELVDEGRTGWLFDPLSPASIRRSLDKIAACSVADLQAMSRRSVERMQDLSPARIAGRALAGIEVVAGCPAAIEQHSGSAA